MSVVLDEARRTLAEGGDVEMLLERALTDASPLERPRVASEAARLLHKAGRAEAAARWYGRAAVAGRHRQELSVASTRW